MILSHKHGNRGGKREDWLLFLGLAILLSSSLWFLFGKGHHQSIIPADALYYCGMEQLENGQFVNNGHYFANGNLQSEEQAHSGRFSCKVPIGSGIQYALTTNIEGIKAGQIWEVSIWHYRQPMTAAKLVVKAVDNPNIYAETAVSIRRDGDWELLQITLPIPFDKVPKSLQVYVYTEGKVAHYFDDLSIRQPRLIAAGEATVPRLHLEVPDKGMSRLKRKRDEAIKRGILIQGKRDWVNAQMRDSTSVFPVKIRLKGDWTDHLRGDKWSFRIHMKKNKSWNRLKTFSVHTPATRYYLHEWLLHQFWQREGVLTTYYDFALLGLNNKELGLYALEEHFEKQLLERQKRREGPILKLSEDGFWQGIGRQLDNHGYQRQEDLMTIMERKNAPVEAFGEKAIHKDSTLQTEWKMATTLLTAFQKGSLPVEDLFDIDKLAKYYAIADVFDAHHALTWHNQRFYFNPLIGKLEPIGYDGFGEKPKRRYQLLGEGSAADDNPYFHQLLGSKEFLRLYYRYLYQYSSAEYFAAFLEEAAPRWRVLLPLVQSEFPDYQYQLDDFLEDAKYVHALLLPFDDYSVNAQKIQYSDSVLLRNRHPLALRILGFGKKKTAVTDSLDIWLSGVPARRYLSRIQRDADWLKYPHNPYLYQDVQKNQPIPERVKVALPKDAKYVFYQLPGVDSVFKSKIGETTVVALPSIASDLSKGGEKYYSIRGRKIFFPSGKLSIKERLVIPEGYQVFFPEGGEYDFIRGAHLISHSPIFVRGTEEHPVVFKSSDGTGRGIAILQATVISEVEYAIFEGMGSFSGHGQVLSGAVSFYESDVLFGHCVFRYNHSEDALNIVRSAFELKHCVFSNTQGDGLDSDFSKGNISYTRFLQIGNDALDCSGSILTVEDCEVDGCGDKGISAGEESDITVFRVKVANAPIAFASKDLSILLLEDITLENCRQGFAAYQKKPEYGGAHIIVKGYRATGVDRLTAVGVGSGIEVIGTRNKKHRTNTKKCE